MEKVLVIVGQTAVGKTAMSIKLAKALKYSPMLLNAHLRK